jgi:HD superfamily phosphohydrolase
MVAVRKVVRDAVHGDIELGPLELEIIDTREFQRLRGIRQLGTASLVYPSALHTRFEHSLGTLWMASKILNALPGGEQIPGDEVGLIRLAALLHDVTHVPFGHTLEDERRVFPRHDHDQARIAWFLEESAIGAILRARGLGGEIREILAGGVGYRSDIVGGAISADLLDYLRRDSYFTGLAQYYDPRVFSLFERGPGGLVMRIEKQGRIRHDAISELVHLLRIRYTLSERVYFHHTKMASGAMISRAVELALGEGFDPVALRVLGDQALVHVLGSV